MGNSNSKKNKQTKKPSSVGQDEIDQRTLKRIREDRIIRAATQEWDNLEKEVKENVSETASQAENQSKNRYGNVKPLDKTRVLLKNCVSDYINASWIDGVHKNSNHSYIATQAPLPGTIDDFWEMVWQEESFIIVMLTKLQESNKIKAHLYWPENVSSELVSGRFTITLVNEELVPKVSKNNETGTAYIIRTLELVETKTDKKRSVYQAHYCSWPDMQVPSSGEDLIAMMTTVNQLIQKSGVKPSENITHPIIVHCSAGLGRAGTFILIHTILHYANENNYGFEDIKIAEILKKLREHRSGLVQTKEQYLFAVKTIKNQLDILHPKVDRVDSKSLYRGTL